MSETETEAGISIDVPEPLADLAARLRMAEDELLHLMLSLVRRARDALG